MLTFVYGPNVIVRSRVVSNCCGYMIFSFEAEAVEGVSLRQ